MLDGIKKPTHTDTLCKGPIFYAFTFAINASVLCGSSEKEGNSNVAEKRRDACFFSINTHMHTHIHVHKIAERN